MTKRKKILLWLGLVLSFPATGYAAMSVVFYSWLNASQPENWPAEKAAIWAYSALALTVVFFVIFVYCLITLIKSANDNYRANKNAI